MSHHSNHTLHRLTWRLLAAALLVALLLPIAAGSITFGQSDTPLDVPFGPTLFLIDAAEQLPPATLPPTTVVHMRLDEPSRSFWIASGAAEDAGAIAAAGLPVTMIDADTSGAVYYIADASAPDAAELAAGVGDILWQDDLTIIVSTTTENELALVESLPAAGVSISLLSALPLAVDDTPVQAAAPAAVSAVPDPLVAALLTQVTTQELQTLVNQLSGATPATVGGAAVTINTRYTLASRIRSAEQYVYEWYQRLGLNVRYANWTYGQYSGRNVVAEVRGAAQPQRVLLVGGHLDSTSNVRYTDAPGADDNATGTAATMILARLLARYQPAVTVRFVHFTGEEQGQWGSKVYASSLRQAGEQVIGFINLDMIGWDGDGDRVVEIHTASGPKSNALADQYLERNERYATGLTFERKTTTASRFSDHSPFWDNDYASFLIIENFFVDARPNDRNPYYHNTGDIASRVNYDYVARIARVSLAAVAELGGYTLSGVAPTPTATSTPRPTATPTVTPTPGPDVCTELLVNGDFEVSGGWQFGSTPFAGRYTTAAVYHGARAVQLGIPEGNANRRAYSTTFQRITIPADAATPVLLRYVERTYGAADSVDYRETLLLNSSYGYVARLTRTYTAGDGVWRERTFDVSAYRGRTLVIYFNVYNNGAGTQLWSFLDRVELGSCVRTSSPEEPTATPDASQTPEPTETAAPTEEPTATPDAGQTPEPTETAPVLPALALAPARIDLGGLLGSDPITLTVQLGEQRNGFEWEAVADAPWLELEKTADADGSALIVRVLDTGLADGVYTATIRTSVVVSPELTADTPVTYVRGVLQPYYLPAVQSAPPQE